MAGNASNPISVTTAPTMPVAVAKIAQVASVAIASAAGIGPAASCSDLNSRSRIFARSITYPMNTKSGIEIRTSFVITE